MGEGDAPKSCHSKCAIIRALAFEERCAKNILNISRIRNEWVHDILAFGATVYVRFFLFQDIAKLALGVEWVVQVQAPDTMWIRPRRQQGRRTEGLQDVAMLMMERCPLIDASFVEENFLNQASPQESVV